MTHLVTGRDSVQLARGTETGTVRDSWNSHCPWYLLWMVIFLFLSWDVSCSYWRCVSQRPLSENSIPIMVGVILAVALVVYGRRSPPFAMRLSSSGLAFLLLIALVTASANYLHFSRLYWLGFIGLIACTLWALAGMDYAKHWSPLFLFSLQLMPTPPAVMNSMSVWLKLASSSVATVCAGLFIPIKQQHNLFYVKGTAFEVSTACCGLSIWAAFLFVILLWQLIKPMSACKIIFLAVVSTITAVALNGLRLCLTALVAYWSSPDDAIACHTNLEYGLFPIGLVFLWKVGSMVRE